MSIDSLKEELLSGVHTFIRIGYDKKKISFLPHRILQGRSDRESTWTLTALGGIFALDIYDVHGDRTYRLMRSEDGAWKGRMEAFEMMPVELCKATSRKPRALIIQQGDGEFTKILRLTHRCHSEYADRHEIHFWSVYGEVQIERDSHWNKIVLIRQALDLDYELVVWMDADTLIVEPETDLRNACVEFSCIGMCKHNSPWREQTWHYNSGVIFIKTCNEAKTFFKKVWDAGPVCHPWHEQVRILECVEQMPNLVQVIDDGWNSNDLINPIQKPCIKAWHGTGFAAHRLQLMADAVLACQ